MKISNITYQSDVNKFVQSSEIEDVKKQFDQVIDKLKEEILESLENEMKEGNGLDAYSFNVNGQSRANTTAINIYKRIADVIANLTSSKEIIEQNLKNHRDKEFETYIDKIDERLSILQSQMSNNTTNSINPTNPSRGASIALQSAGSVLQSEIDNLVRKKTTAQTLWAKI